jgi:dTDP-4-amino-4,6-dideoxygalactose transaminase
MSRYPNLPVTKTFLPDLAEYCAILNQAWQEGWITNRGKLVLRLEEELTTYLGSHHIIATNNGTVPLQIAIKALGLIGEIITTPFSYVATTAAIVWEQCKPVFVDIDPHYLTINEELIEDAITEHTTAILATHVFGNPCEVERIKAIAAKYNLKVIYDAAHCFGVRYKGESIFDFGDVSTCSFHATKVFHSGEGGALFTTNKTLYDKLYYSHNFGHNGPLDFHGLGINGKMSELQGALGLAVLKHMPEILQERRSVVDAYHHKIEFGRVNPLQLREQVEWNFSYYPIVFETSELMSRTLEEMNRHNIFPRRYFYPALNTIKYTAGGTMPVAESVADRILCLPLYVGMSKGDIERVCKILNVCTK